MAMLNDDVFDAALNEIRNNATVLHICSAQPADYAGIAAVSLGTKTTPLFTAPLAGDVSGRKITVQVISDGVVNATGTAGFFAIADSTRLLVSGALSATQAVTENNSFTLTAFDIEIRDPA